jgi:hypothetical protein
MDVLCSFPSELLDENPQIFDYECHLLHTLAVLQQVRAPGPTKVSVSCNNDCFTHPG